MTRPLPRRGTTVSHPQGPHAVYATSVRSNGVRRPILRWEDLTAKEQTEHDWAAPSDPEGYSHHNFIRYCGVIIPLENFSRLDPRGGLGLAGWDGAAPDSWTAGQVIRLVTNAYGEQDAIVGRYWQVSA